MLSLPPRRIPPGGGSISRILTSLRSHSILAAASSGNFTARQEKYDQNNVSCHHLNHYQHHPNNNANTSKRYLSKYASVDHSAAYRDAMASTHGVQLQLALKEGEGKDDAPFDPFSQFLDQMGCSDHNTSIDGYQQHGEVEGDEDIEEAEYETIDEHEEEGDEAQQEEEGFGDDGEVEDDLDDVEDEGPVYTTTGALHRPKSEKLALRAGYPAGGSFAVIFLAGFQHKVTVDDLLVVNKLKPVSHWCVGSTHTIKDDDVLLMGNQDKTLVGLPGVKGGEVDVMVEEITRDKTLVIFKKRRRKNSRRKNGFRRQVTFLRVLDVRMPKGEELVKNNDREEDAREEVDVRAAA